MKKLILPSIGMFASLLTAQAQTQYFYPTNLVVLEQQTTNLDGGVIGIIQFETNGIIVNTTNLPSTSGLNPIILGNATSSSGATEGFMTLSANSNELVVPGFNTAAPYTGVLELSTSASVPRAVATLDAYDTYALPIHNPTIYSKEPIRGAASDGLGNYWVSGANPSGGTTNNGEIGVVYVGTASHGVNVSVTETGTGNEQCLAAFNGSLYLSTETAPGAGIYLISNVSGTYPQVEGSSVNNSNIIALNEATPAPFAFAINTAGTIAYVADQGVNGVEKFTNGPSGWAAAYTLSVAAPGSGTSPLASGCTVDWSGSHPIIYATSADSPPNYLVRIVDTGASATALVIGTAPANTIFRSVQFGPGAHPIITNAPVSTFTDVGENASFSVEAMGAPILAYQWYSNNPVNTNFFLMTGATNSTLSLTNAVSGQSNTMYYVIVSNGYGTAQSTNVTLKVDPLGGPTNVVVTPGSTNINAEGLVVFTASFIGGTNSLSFGWRHNGTLLANGAFGASTISGATTDSLTISNAFATNAGSYTVYVTNSFGYGTNVSPAVLTVNDPAILTNVMGVTNFPGNGPVPLSVSAVGTGTLTYQWLSNGTVISGATTSAYTASNQTTPTSTSYSVVVTSTDGKSVTNGPAIVAFSDLLVQENFNYPNGSDLFTDPGSPWTVINTTVGAPEIVYSNMAQVAFTNATTDSQDLFNTNVLAEIGVGTGGIDGVYWVSFTVNLSSLPTTPGGVYFANLEDVNYNFYGRIFCLTSNNMLTYPGVGANFPSSVPTVAYPGTYRLGISDSQGDYAAATDGSSGPTAVVPLDLAPGIDYTVVYCLDYLNLYSRMAINPASSNDVLSDYAVVGVSSGASDDAFDDTTSPPLGYGLRQRGGEGILYVGNLKVAAEPFYNGSDSYFGFSYVTAGITASNPVIGLQPVGVTNYLGNSLTMEVAASGIGAAGVGLTYAWYKNTLADPSVYAEVQVAGDVTNVTSPALSFSEFTAADAGTYYVKVTGTAGTTQSASTVLFLNTNPTAPTFNTNIAPNAVNPPASTTLNEGPTLSFPSLAIGTGPISYQWYFSSGGSYSPAPGSSATSATYVFQAEPAASGSYYVVATGVVSPPATSSVAVVTVTGPASETIGYLRNLQDFSGAPASIVLTNTGSGLYSITGTVSTYESITSGVTSSYYLQDATGGINLFITGDTTFRPAAGDVVTATGTLEEYNNNLELDLTAGVDSYAIVMSNGLPVTNALPTAQLLPWGYLQAPNLISSNLNINLLGSRVYVTNAYFTNVGYYVTNGVTNYGYFTNTDYDYTITNAAGQSYSILIGDGVTGTNLNGVTIPAFAYSVSGVLALYTTNYEIIVTSPSEIVTNQPANRPTITVGPVSVTNYVGATVSFSATTVTGTGPFTYAWTSNSFPLANGGQVSGATNATLTISDINLSDAATYAVTASNSGGSSTPASATLTVLPAPSPNIYTAGLSGTSVAFQFSSGDPYDATSSFNIQGSTNLAGVNEGFTNITSGLTITQLSTNSGTAFSVLVTTNAAVSQEFYRIQHK